MGTFEEAKGKVKKVVADITDDPQLRQEGEVRRSGGRPERRRTQERAKASA